MDLPGLNLHELKGQRKGTHAVKVSGNWRLTPALANKYFSLLVAGSAVSIIFKEEGRAYGDLLEHTLEVEFRNHTIHVLDLKMLIQLKRKPADPRDLQRLPVLEETLRQLEEENE